jgi:hypothetical protein
LSLEKQGIPCNILGRICRSTSSFEGVKERKSVMKSKSVGSPLARRSFLSRLGLGVSAAGAAGAGAPRAEAQNGGSERWQPARHEQDDWLDRIPGKHRFVFDTISSEGMASAIQFATNYFNANQSGYGLTDSDLAVVIIARHKSTAFAYNDSIWKKYGVALTNRTGYTSERSDQPLTFNPHATAGNESGQNPGPSGIADQEGCPSCGMSDGDPRYRRIAGARDRRRCRCRVQRACRESGGQRAPCSSGNRRCESRTGEGLYVRPRRLVEDAASPDSFFDRIPALFGRVFAARRMVRAAKEIQRAVDFFTDVDGDSVGVSEKST